MYSLLFLRVAHLLFPVPLRAVPTFKCWTFKGGEIIVVGPFERRRREREGRRREDPVGGVLGGPPPQKILQKKDHVWCILGQFEAEI